MDHGKKGKLVAAEKRTFAIMEELLDAQKEAGGKIPSDYIKKRIDEWLAAHRALRAFDPPYWEDPNDPDYEGPDFDDDPADAVPITPL